MAKSPRKGSRSTGVSTTSLLTLAERRVLDSSVGRTLAEATQKQLQATLARARILRDKWQDLFKRQTLAAKRTLSRGQPVNTRSLDKSELFAAAVKRIEARITQATEAVAAAVGAMEETVGGKGKRAAASVKKPARKPTAAKPVPKKSAARKAAAADRPATAPLSISKPATSKKARQAGARKALAASAAGQAIGFDPKKQRSAKASATRAQFKLDGLSTRRRGHDLVSGKRKQARRDGR
jgi:hypothetical protein